MARRNGEADSRRFGHRASDALYGVGQSDHRPHEHRTGIREAAAGEARADAAVDEQRFRDSAGVDDYRVEVHGTMPNDAVLLSFFPHLHLRGKEFEYNIIHSPTSIEPLLDVHYNFFWQLSYRLETPISLKKGVRLQCWGTFDNSANNPGNPDPSVDVTYGQQSWEEMMVGFFDVAVDVKIGKPEFFIRK